VVFNKNTLSKIALGSVQFGVDYGINSLNGKLDTRDVKDILEYAYSQNIDLLDTAPSYEKSENILGDADIQNFKVVTKTRVFSNPLIGTYEVNLIKKDFFNSLKNLKKESVYGVLVHNADDLMKPGGQKIFEQLVALKQDKKIEKIGVSVYDNNQLKLVITNFDIDLVQLPYNIFDRRMVDNGMLLLLQTRGIEVHARSVFLQGLLLMTEQNRPSKFKDWNALWRIWHEWLNDNKITALEATIRHAIFTPEISKVLVGVDSLVQLKEIISASDGFLPNIPKELNSDDINLLNPSNWGKL